MSEMTTDARATDSRSAVGVNNWGWFGFGKSKNADEADGLVSEAYSVVSSNLRDVSYKGNRNKGTLEVGFKSNHRYVYYDVPYVVFQELMAAPSKGQYHYYEIRDTYEYAKIR